MKIIDRLRRLWKIAENYSKDLSHLAVRTDHLEKTINERTTVHVDVHHKKPCHVIVIGEYRGKDYVRGFEVDAKHLSELIDHLRRVYPYAKVGRMDMIPHVKFSAVYPHERL